MHSSLTINRVNKYSTDMVRDRLKISGYEILFPCSWHEFGQARLIVYVADSINYKQRDIHNLYSDLPNVTLEIGFGKERKTVVNVFYREWTGGLSGLGDHGSQVERLQRQISYWQTLYDEDRDVLMCGDANLCAMTWNDTDLDHSKKVLANMVQEQLL